MQYYYLNAVICFASSTDIIKLTLPIVVLIAPHWHYNCTKMIAEMG